MLAEIFNICDPDINTFQAEVLNNRESYRSILENKHNEVKKTTEEIQQKEKLPSYIEDFITTHDKFDIRKIDLLKIGALEILMSLIQFANT